MSNQNFVLTSAQFNELSSFINTSKLSLEKINSLLSNLQPESQSETQPDESKVITKVLDTSINGLVEENNKSNIEHDSKNTHFNSEKHWWICDSKRFNWVSNRDKLLASFDLNVSSFLDTLGVTQAVVAGGFAVNCLFGFDLDNYTGDLDIFLCKKQTNRGPYYDLKFINECMSENDYTLSFDTELSKPYDLSQHYTTPHDCPEDFKSIEKVVKIYQSLHKVERLLVFSKTVNNVKKTIQVIFTDYNCVKTHIRSFDMSICQTFFDMDSLYIRFKYHILTLERVNVLLKKVDILEDIKYLKRIYKYQSRGFKSYFDIKNSPFVFNKNDKSKAALKYQTINDLLEWKENSPVILFNSLKDRHILSYTRTMPDSTLIVNDTCCITPNGYLNQDLISFKNVKNGFLCQQLIYLVDSSYNILFVKGALMILKSWLERTYGLNMLIQKENVETIKLVKDPVLYLDEVETKLKKIQSSYRVMEDEKLVYSSLASYIRNIFYLLYEPLQLFDNLERIGNPFKHKYSELFNTYIEFIQEKLPIFKETIKQEWGSSSDYTYIQNIVYINYTEPIFKNIKDVRWLLSLMLVYPDLFVFTEKHYKDAVNNNVARDNLYLLKKFLKKDIENDKYADNN